MQQSNTRGRGVGKQERTLAQVLVLAQYADISKGKSKFQGTEARVCVAWLGRAQKLLWLKETE